MTHTHSNLNFKNLQQTNGMLVGNFYILSSTPKSIEPIGIDTPENGPILVSMKIKDFSNQKFRSCAERDVMWEADCREVSRFLVLRRSTFHSIPIAWSYFRHTTELEFCGLLGCWLRQSRLSSVMTFCLLRLTWNDTPQIRAMCSGQHDPHNFAGLSAKPSKPTSFLTASSYLQLFWMQADHSFHSSTKCDPVIVIFP